MKYFYRFSILNPQWGLPCQRVKPLLKNDSLYSELVILVCHAWGCWEGFFWDNLDLLYLWGQYLETIIVVDIPRSHSWLQLGAKGWLLILCDSPEGGTLYISDFHDNYKLRVFASMWQNSETPRSCIFSFTLNQHYKKSRLLIGSGEGRYSNTMTLAGGPRGLLWPHLETKGWLLILLRPFGGGILHMTPFSWTCKIWKMAT